MQINFAFCMKAVMDEIKQTQNSNPKNETDSITKIGLWLGIGAASIATIVVLGLAFYTHYQAKQTDLAEENAASQTLSEFSGSVPLSENEAAQIATQITDLQVQGMIAPADEGEENDMASSPITASEIASTPNIPTVSQ